MLQNELTNYNPELLENKHQTLQLNRLLKFIQNKRTPSFNKLKQILSNKESQYSQAFMLNSKEKNKQQNSSIVVNTKNMFVHRNKTQNSSPRTLQNSQNKYYKIFITKQQIMRLHDKEKSQLFSSNLSLQNKVGSNLFPPLAVPKIKNHAIYKRQQDQTDQKSHQYIKNSKRLFQQNKYSKQATENEKNIQQYSNSKGTKQKYLQNLKLQRQQYNKSLQKLIEKAFKNRHKEKFNINDQNNLNLSSQRKSIQTETMQESQTNCQSIYASKGKLISNPNLKIKKDNRLKGQKGQLLNRLISSRPKLDIINKSFNTMQMEKNKKVIHTNRQFSNENSTFKIKTEVTIKASQYQPSSIKKQNKTLKLINQLQQSIIKPEAYKQAKKMQPIQRRTVNKLEPKVLEILNNVADQTLLKQMAKNHKKRRNQSVKAKTTQSQQLPSLLKKTLASWQLGEHYWQNNNNLDIQQNIQLQSYVQNIIKRQKSMTLQQNMGRSKKRVQ